MKEDVLKNIANFTGKQLPACNVSKERLQHMCFPLYVWKFLTASYLKQRP